jgi:hypothetical protein
MRYGALGASSNEHPITVGRRCNQRLDDRSKGELLPGRPAEQNGKQSGVWDRASDEEKAELRFICPPLIEKHRRSGFVVVQQ